MVSTQSEFRKKFADSAAKRKSNLILALDTPKIDRIHEAVEKAGDNLAAIKVHPEYPLIWGHGHEFLPNLMDELLKERIPLIMDAKLADIDNSNAMKARYYFSQGYDAIICHGFSGQPAVQAVIDVANEMGKGVFLLTAMTSKGHLFDKWKIEKLARMAKELDVAGVIAPGNNYGILRTVRRLVGPELLILSPGIGAQGGEADKAFIAGSDFAIVGRHIVDVDDPGKAAMELKDLMNKALKSKTLAKEENELGGYDALFSALVEKQVLKFGNFTLKSGRPSAYFFNAGKIDDGKSIAAAAEAYADVIFQSKLHEKYDVLFGPAYKGIPIATYVAQTLYLKYNINMRAAYDRKEEKTHGDATGGAAKDKLIVGDIRQGDRVLLLDDVITTGGTKIETKEKLESLGLELNINGVLILFDRQETDLQGNDPLNVFKSQGMETFVVLKAKEVFGYLRNKEIDGKILVTDDLYNAFKKHQEEFGRK